MKTAITQLMEYLKENSDFGMFNDHHINHYLEIEKQQIIKAYNSHPMALPQKAEQYFLNTYTKQN